MARINIFTGHFGSGKTEIALNFALDCARKGEKICIVDMDIVNPYFCTRDVTEMLKGKGIKVISTLPELSNAELMVVTPEVLTAFANKEYKVIIDVGGDDSGAVVLGQYNRYFKEEAYDMYFVINYNRPLTPNNLEVIEYINSVERASRLKITSLISNTNLSYETTSEDVIWGDKEVEGLSKALGVPHDFTVCTHNLVPQLDGKVKGTLFPIETFMKVPWR